MSCFISQSAAALCISVGSFSDPADLPGLAHFLEHSAFLDVHFILTFLFYFYSHARFVSLSQWSLWAVRSTRPKMALMLS